MKPEQLARALVGDPKTPTDKKKPLDSARLAKFRMHIQGTGNGARKPKDESFTRDTLAAIEHLGGAEAKTAAERALNRT